MTRTQLASAGTIVFLLTAVLVLATSSSSRAQESSDALSTCVARNGSLSSLFLVDTSVSLQTNDPENERVEAIRSALSALAALHSSSEVTVHVAFMDFGAISRRSFPEGPEWTVVPGNPEEHAAIAIQFAERNDGGATDYVAALEPWANAELKPADEIGALELLERAPEGSCRLLVWFTDGQLDIGYYGRPRTITWTDPPTLVNSDSVANAMRAAAIAKLCSPGGLADRLRSGTAIASGSSAQVSIVALDKQRRLDFGLLRAFATGEGRDAGCGSEQARGTFGTADDIGSLALGLRRAVLGESHGETEGTRSCLISTETCDDVSRDIQEYDYTFYLSPGIQRFNLLTLSSHPSVKTTIIMPDGTSFELYSGNQVMQGEGVELNSQELQLQSGAFLVDAELSPRGSWDGPWRVRYATDDPAVAYQLNRASIYVFGSLMMELDASHSSLQAGIQNEIVFHIVAADSEPATATTLQSGTEMRVWVNNEVASDPVMHSDGTYSVIYAIPSDFANNLVLVEGSLAPVIQLAPNAPLIPLTSWTGNLGELAVEPVGGYPLIEGPLPFEENLSEESRRLETTMFIDSSRIGTGGCVDVMEIGAPSIGSQILDLQVLDGERSIDVADPCPISLIDGQTASLTVVVDSTALESLEEQVGAGILRLRASNPIDPSRFKDYVYRIDVSVDVPEPIRPEKIVDSVEPEPEVEVIPETKVITETDAVKALILTLIVVLFLIALLYGTNSLSSRLIVGRLTSVNFPVAISGGTLRRLDDAGNHVPLAIDGRDIHSHPLAGGVARSRSVELGEVTVRATTPLLPLAKSSARAIAENATLVVGSRGTSDGGRTGRLPRSLSGEWLFHTDEVLERGEAQGSLAPIIGTFTMMIPFEAEAAFANAQLQERADEIGEQINTSAEAVADEPAEAMRPDSGEADGDHDNDEQMTVDDDPTAMPTDALAQLGEDSVLDEDDLGIWDYEDEDDW